MRLTGVHRLEKSSEASTRTRSKDTRLDVLPKSSDRLAGGVDNDSVAQRSGVEGLHNARLAREIRPRNQIHKDHRHAHRESVSSRGNRRCKP